MTKEDLFSKVKSISQNSFFVKNNIVTSHNLRSGSALKRRIWLLKRYNKLFNLFYPGSPWTTPASVIIFRKLLNKSMTGLEYGSGRSTLFFARRLKKLVSIEHHEGWHKKVSQILEGKKVVNVEYLLIPEDRENANVVSESELHNQLNQLTGDEPREEYLSYYSRVESYPDDHFDFILIDGRARVQCGLRAMKKIKPGGMFVLDNSERKRYQPLHEALREWPKVFTTNGITDTVIWIRPHD